MISLSQEAARQLNHNYIGTEHLLAALVCEGNGEARGVAAKVLADFGLTYDGVLDHIREIIGPGQLAPSGHIPFTPRAKKILEVSLREALDLGHNYIGTEHLLLALITENEGVGAQILRLYSAAPGDEGTAEFLHSIRQAVLAVIGYLPKGPVRDPLATLVQRQEQLTAEIRQLQQAETSWMAYLGDLPNAGHAAELTDIHAQLDALIQEMRATTDRAQELYAQVDKLLPAPSESPGDDGDDD